MKNRKMWYVCLVLLPVLLLCFCERPRKNTQYDISQVQQVSFVQVTQEGEITELETLDPNSLEAFFEDFGRIPCKIYWNDPSDCIIGPAIRIIFQDGSYHLISHYCTIHSQNGQSKDTRQWYSYEDFLALWDQYCSYEYNIP